MNSQTPNWKRHRDSSWLVFAGNIVGAGGGLLLGNFILSMKMELLLSDTAGTLTTILSVVLGGVAGLLVTDFARSYPQLVLSCTRSFTDMLTDFVRGTLFSPVFWLGVMLFVTITGMVIIAWFQSHSGYDRLLPKTLSQSASDHQANLARN